LTRGVGYLSQTKESSRAGWFPPHLLAGNSAFIARLSGIQIGIGNCDREQSESGVVHVLSCWCLGWWVAGGGGGLVSDARFLRRFP
jgi:hypothetical protein